MAEDRWYRLDLPVLEAAVELDADGQSIEGSPLATATGLGEDEIALALQALLEANYFEGRVTKTFGPTRIIHIHGITEKARRETGQWPSGDLYESLLAVLRADIERTDDPEKKTKLQAMRDAASSIGRDVVVEVLTRVATGQLPG